MPAYAPFIAPPLPVEGSWRRRLWIGLGAAAVVVALVAAAVDVHSKQIKWLADPKHPQRLEPAIAGAPTYATVLGPHGRPLAVGRPWGKKCQPVRIIVSRSVPAALREQAQNVVDEARRAGIEVATVPEGGLSFPQWFVYGSGLTQADDVRASLFADAHAPNEGAANPDLLNNGWDAAVDADGTHERLTNVAATVHMSSARTDFDRRRAVRLFIALAMGVDFSTTEASAIRSGATADAFTAADVAAMQLMSGCGTSAVGKLSVPVSPPEPSTP